MSNPFNLLVVSGLLGPWAGAFAQSQTWEILKTETTASFRGLSVVSDQVIWASGTRSTVIRSVDGGTTWSVDSILNGSTFDLRAIHATSDRVAHVAATAGRIWKTIDGGKTWSLKYQAADTSMFLDAIAFRNEREGYALGDPMNGQFVILVTRDGGESWREAQGAARPIANDGEAAFAASGTSLIMKGRFGWLGTGGATARVYRTTDEGSTWRAHQSAIPAKSGSGGVFSVAFADSLHGIVVGGDYQQPDSTAGTAAYTADGGLTWVPAVQLPRGFRSGVTLRGINPDRSIAIAVGTNGSDVSRDGGKTWTPLDATGFNAVQFAPSGVAFAVGARGRIARMSVR